MEIPSVPSSSELRFRARLRTRWSDEDNQQVLNNAVYLTLLEEARYAYFAHLGLIEENRFPFLLAQANVLFLAPGHGGADVEVEMSTIDLGTSSFTQAYRVREVASSFVWCEAVARLVAFDDAKRTSRPMTAAFRGAIEAFEGGA